MTALVQTGLVLSGGGAKGAYQVGMIRALAELQTPVGAVAGASIGALNGAILAAAPSLEEGSRRLEEVWTLLGGQNPQESRPQPPRYLTLLAAAGLQISGLEWLARTASTLMPEEPSVPQWFDALRADLTPSGDGLLSATPLRQLMHQYLDLDDLAQGYPLYISVYPSSALGGAGDLIRWGLAEMGLSETRDSEFLLLQDLPREEQISALLASAALPILFPSQMVQGKLYSDGGIGGAMRLQGLTPITPLVNAGYRHIVANHLSDGSLWDRHDFPEAAVIEIRPQKPIQRKGSFKDLLAFDSETIESWIHQGYSDTIHCMKRVLKPLQALNRMENAQSVLQKALGRLEDSATTMQEEMKRLRSS